MPRRPLASEWNWSTSSARSNQSAGASAPAVIQTVYEQTRRCELKEKLLKVVAWVAFIIAVIIAKHVADGIRPDRRLGI